MKGSITVFLSMIMMVIISTVTVSVESARLACTRLLLKQAGGYSIKSVFADYYVPLFKDYGLMFLDVTYGGSENVVTEKYDGYLSYNLNPGKGRLERRSFFYTAEILNIEAEDIIYAVEGGGKIVKRQIYDYMKYKLPANFAENFLAQYDYITHADKLKQFFEQLGEIEDELKDIDELVLEINNITDKIREHELRVSELKEQIEGLKDLNSEEYEKLSKLLKEETGKLSEALSEREADADLCDCIRLEVWEYLEELGAEWLNNVEIPTFIKEIISEEIEEVIDELEKTYKEEDSAEDDIPDDILKTDWKHFGKELKSFELYSLLCPGYSDIPNSSINTFYNRNYAERGGSLVKIPETSVLETVAENVCLAEYAVMLFADYCNPMENRPFLYETEYIIGGSLNEKENIKSVINKLIGVREILNLIYLMSDSEKKDMAYTIALALAGAGGGATVKITQYLIMAVWALGEALVDVRLLMSGSGVPLIKSAEDWKLDLYGITDIFEIISTTDNIEASKSEGFMYEDYLKIILFANCRDEMAFRIMDIVEADIQNKYYSGFYFNNCAYYMRIKAEYCSKPLFDSMGILLPKTSVSCQFSY